METDQEIFSIPPPPPPPPPSFHLAMISAIYCGCTATKTTLLSLLIWSTVHIKLLGHICERNNVHPYQAAICKPGHEAQSVGHLTRKSEVMGSIPSLATYFRFSFRFLMKGSCQLLAEVCARSTG